MTHVSDQTVNLPSWRVKFFEDLKRSVQLEGKKVLEIGCGDGAIAKLVARHTNPQFVYGIDPYSYAIYPIYEEEKLMFLNLNADNLLFPNSYFDVIFSHNVFEHILDLPQVWQEIKRVLKPGGIFYTHFAPLWTHAYGHHYYDETDESFSCIIPPYAHLYMKQEQINQLLKANNTLPEEQKKARIFIFGDVCNKMFPSEYRKVFLSNDDFKIEEYLEIKQHHHNRPTPQEVLEKYPSVPKEDFEISGITVKGVKLSQTQRDSESLKEVYRVYARYTDEQNKKLLRRLSTKLKSIFSW